MALSRRDLLRNSAVGAGVLAVGNVATLLNSTTALAAPNGAGSPASGVYGDLVADPAGVLDLPPGFSYRIVSAEYDASGTAVIPGRFDGTGAFAGPNKEVRLVRNNEQSTSGVSTVSQAGDPRLVYDPAAAGGTMTVVLDKHNNTIDEFVSIAGTYNNCAGGATPWGTWLTCEETDVRAGQRGMTLDHGWVFEVDPFDQARNLDPVPLRDLGRFPHEAAVVDPATGEVYLSEDASGPLGLMYKCVPNNPAPGYGNLRDGGTLWAMVCSLDGAPVPTLHPFAEIGTSLDVSWVPVPDPYAAEVNTRAQFSDDQVTRSRKFEGLWWDSGRCYIVCSFSDQADGQHSGQVWSLDPLTSQLTLEVRYEAGNQEAPDEPDNITISPWGGMILCEDSDSTQHLLAVAPDGSTSLFARNHGNDSELTGACFSPDRKTLFANVQSPGVTFAITGPFARINRGR